MWEREEGETHNVLLGDLLPQHRTHVSAPHGKCLKVNNTWKVKVNKQTKYNICCGV